MDGDHAQLAAPEYPCFPINKKDSECYHLLSMFYVISDTRNEDEMYMRQFTSDATLIMGNTMAKGHQGKRSLHCLQLYCCKRRKTGRGQRLK